MNQKNIIQDFEKDPSEIIRRSTEKAEQEARLKEYQDNLDFNKLEDLKQKPISELNDEDLLFIGIERYPEWMKNVGAQYKCYSIADPTYKLYLDRLPDGTFESWEFKPDGVNHLKSTSELIYECILRWRLKLVPQAPKIRIEPITNILDIDELWK